MITKILFTIIAVVATTIIGSVLIVAFISGPEPSSTNAANTDAQQLALRAIGKLKLKPNWEKIEVNDEKTKDRHYQLSLYYLVSPSNWDEAEADTKTIARAILSELVASGAKPSEERISVWVYAWCRVKGETGKDLFEGWGHTHFDDRHNSLIFGRDYL